MIIKTKPSQCLFPLTVQIPLSYTRHSARFLFTWLIFLPFDLVGGASHCFQAKFHPQSRFSPTVD